MCSAADLAGDTTAARVEWFLSRPTTFWRGLDARKLDHLYWELVSLSEEVQDRHGATVYDPAWSDEELEAEEQLTELLCTHSAEWWEDRFLRVYNDIRIERLRRQHLPRRHATTTAAHCDPAVVRPRTVSARPRERREQRRRSSSSASSGDPGEPDLPGVARLGRVLHPAQAAGGDHTAPDDHCPSVVVPSPLGDPKRCSRCHIAHGEICWSVAAQADLCLACYCRLPEAQYRPPATPPVRLPKPKPYRPSESARLIAQWQTFLRRTELPYFNIAEGPHTKLAGWCPLCGRGALTVEFFGTSDKPEAAVSSCSAGCRPRQIVEVM